MNLLEVLKTPLSLHCRSRENRERCLNHKSKGRLAQLVQSVCLTSRGSGVRIPQRPQQEQEETGFVLLLFFYNLTANDPPS